MLSQQKGVLIGAVVVALATLAPPAAAAEDRFTFGVANASQITTDDKGPWEIVIDRWSTDAEREAVLSASGDGSGEELRDAIAQGMYLGYVAWPGSVRYILRYAQRSARADGGEDVVVATDAPVWVWWDQAHAGASTSAPFTVIQLRLDQSGAGEGKLSLGTPVGSSGDAKGIVLEQYAAQPTLLVDVRRAAK